MREARRPYFARTGRGTPPPHFLQTNARRAPSTVLFANTLPACFAGGPPPPPRGGGAGQLKWLSPAKRGSVAEGDEGASISGGSSGNSGNSKEEGGRGTPNPKNNLREFFLANQQLTLSAGSPAPRRRHGRRRNTPLPSGRSLLYGPQPSEGANPRAAPIFEPRTSEWLA